MTEDKITVLGESIKRRFKYHLRTLGYRRDSESSVLSPSEEKLLVRSMQSKRRSEHLKEERGFIDIHYPDLKKYFAEGSEIEPEHIEPKLELVKGGTEFSDLFRLASLTWGVPVSNGYGRRLRFLVLDGRNGKLMGLIGLADPVFNLSARDEAIGWTVQDRKERLVDVMNAYILGALPPYNMLLGGKVVSSLVRTREVRDAFNKKYRESRGIISGKAKRPSLVMVTTTSSLGRSAIYDRLKLEHEASEVVTYFSSVGYTLGWGHFHVPNSLFRDMRIYLNLIGHPYANGYKYGNGSNWRLRASQETLRLLGLRTNLMNHGVKREIFLSRLASNADKVLRGETKTPMYTELLPVKEVGKLAVNRWVIKRSETRKEYLSWNSENVLDLLNPKLNGLLSLHNLPSSFNSTTGFENELVYVNCEKQMDYPSTIPCNFVITYPGESQCNDFDSANRNRGIDK